MDIAWIIFALLIALCIVMGIILFTEELPFEIGEDGTKTYLGHGIAHPQFDSMLRGGDGAQRHEKILWLGWAFGALQCAFFVACLIFGAQKKGVYGPTLRPLLIGGLIYIAIFTVLIYSYDKNLPAGAEAPLFLSFPHATAWMLYGIWGFPLFFAAIFFIKYDSWIFREEDLVEFRSIVDRYQNQNNQTQTKEQA